MYIQKENESLRNFKMIKLDFSSSSKKKLISLNLYCFGPEHKFERKKPTLYFWWFKYIRNFLNGLFFAKSKNFRLHATLQDAAESVKSITHKRPGYCFVLPGFPRSCFHNHVTGLLFCLYIQVQAFLWLFLILTKVFSKNCYHHESVRFGYWGFWKQNRERVRRVQKRSNCVIFLSSYQNFQSMISI